MVGLGLTELAQIKDSGDIKGHTIVIHFPEAISTQQAERYGILFRDQLSEAAKVIICSSEVCVEKLNGECGHEH